MQLGEFSWGNFATAMANVAQTGLQTWGEVEAARAIASRPAGISAFPMMGPVGSAGYAPSQVPPGVTPQMLPAYAPVQSSGLFSGDLTLPLAIGAGVILLVLLIKR